MSKTKYKKKQDKKNDLLENPEALAEQLTKTEQFLEQNRKIVIAVIGILAVLTSAVFLVRYYISNQDQKAQADMFQAVYYFEADSLNRALDGDGNNYGFLEIIDKYGFTKTANLAEFYAGASYLKLGDYETAIDHLSEFSADDIAVQSRAYSLIGDAYMELNDYRKGAEFYEKAALHMPNEFLSPTYLVKAAVAYEKLMDFETASDCYNQIIEKYPDSNEFQNARKHKARLDGLAAK